MRGEVGAGVAALDEAGSIVAHDDLLALAVHSGGVWRWRGLYMYSKGDHLL